MDTTKPKSVIFPEATVGNGLGLLNFKKGAFLGGFQIQMVVLEYSSGFCLDYLSILIHQLFLQCNLFNKLEVVYIGTYQPDETEKEDWQLYANNVRNVMAKQLGVMTYELSYD